MALATPHASGTTFWSSVAGGVVGGGISSACLGSGAALLASTACGGVGGAAGDYVTQLFDNQKGIDYSHIGIAAAEGAAGGALGGIGAAKINNGWLALANRNPRGLSARNLLPWTTTGSLGTKLQFNNFIGTLWSSGVSIWGENLYNSNHGKACNS